VTGRAEVAALAVAFAVSGLVAVALAFAGVRQYEILARAGGFTQATFHVDDRGIRRDVVMELPALLDWHHRWLLYVTARVADPPAAPGVAVFTPDEYAHMADVRRVFIGAQAAALVAGVTAIVLVARARRRGATVALVLIRRASLAAAAVVAIVGLAAAFAFDALFLLFHEIFFPQGNFLFPADSNLLALYPDQYWYGVTLRVGVSFVGAMSLIALVMTATLRRSRRYTPRS